MSGEMTKSAAGFAALDRLVAEFAARRTVEERAAHQALVELRLMLVESAPGDSMTRARALAVGPRIDRMIRKARASVKPAETLEESMAKVARTFARMVRP